MTVLSILAAVWIVGLAFVAGFSLATDSLRGRVRAAEAANAEWQQRWQATVEPRERAQQEVLDTAA